jgi:hypothetical protein
LGRSLRIHGLELQHGGGLALPADVHARDAPGAQVGIDPGGDHPGLVEDGVPRADVPAEVAVHAERGIDDVRLLPGPGDALDGHFSAQAEQPMQVSMMV